MKITKGVINRDEAFLLVPTYVTFIELRGSKDRWTFFDKIDEEMKKMYRGQEVITFVDGLYIRCKVTKVDHNSFQAVDGPVIRVSNGEFSWRVDGDKYAYPV